MPASKLRPATPRSDRSDRADRPAAGGAVPRLRWLRPLVVVLLALLVAGAPAALAQSSDGADPLRVVVVPFEADEATGPFGIGLATALHRALNTLDNVYAPPLGEAVIVTQRALEAEADPIATLERLFDADHIVGGRIAVEGSALRLELEIDGEIFPVRSERSSAPALAQAFGRTLIDRLFADVRTSEQNAFLDVLAATPSAASLGSATLSASLLPGVALSDLEAASQLDAGSSWVRAEYARQLARRGDLAAARAQAERAVEVGPNDVEARLVLAGAQFGAGDVDAARTTYQAALDLNPAHPLALLGLARIDGSQRAARLEAALAANPRLLDAYLLLAAAAPTAQDEVRVLRGAAGHLLDSAAYHRALVEAILDAGDALGALNHLRDASRQALSASPGLYAIADELPASLAEEAAGFVAAGRELFPDSAELLVVDARLAIERGDLDAAIETLEGHLADAPGDDAARNALAVAYARRGDIDAARQAVEAIDDPSATGRLNLALIYLEAGRVRAALSTTTALLDAVGGIEQAGASVLAAHGLALALTGEIDEGRSALERAAELDPDATLPQRALAQLEQREQFGVEAVEIDAEARPAFDRGLFALNRGDYTGAAAAFADARDVADAGILAYYHGLALLRSGDARSAVPAYQVALEQLGPNQRPTVLGNLGFAHLQLGRYDLALDALRESVELDPDVPQVHVSLGLTYFGLRRYAEALASFERAIALDPSLESQLSQVVAESRRRSPQ